jgi:hypothetical protein
VEFWVGIIILGVIAVIIFVGPAITDSWISSDGAKFKFDNPRSSSSSSASRFQPDPAVVRQRSEFKQRTKSQAEVNRRKAMIKPLVQEADDELEKRPRDGGLHLKRGHLHASLGEWDAAAEYYKRALALAIADEKERALAHFL